MDRKKRLKVAVRVLQILLLFTAFLFFFGIASSILYVLGEIDFAIVLDYLLVMTNVDFGFIVFLEGLYYFTFQRGKKVRKK